MLKLYTVPRHKQQKQKYVLKNGCYKSLRDCEKGQYGVLSITNPNYEASLEGEQLQQQLETCISDDEDEDIFTSGSLSVPHPMKVVAANSDCLQPTSSVTGEENYLSRPHADTFLASRSECDKSFRTGGNSAGNIEPQEVDRILTQGIIKRNEDGPSGSGCEEAAAAVVGLSGDVLELSAGIRRNPVQTLPLNGKLSGALSISELERRPLPSAV